MFGAITGAVGAIAGGKNPLEAVTSGFNPGELLGGLTDPSKLMAMAAPMLGPYAGIAQMLTSGDMDPAKLASGVFGKSGPMQKEGAMSVDQLLQQILGGNKEGAQAPTEAPAGEVPAAEAAAPTKEAKLDGIKDILTQILGQLNGEKPTEKQAGSEEAPTGEVPAEEVPAEEVPAEGAPAEGINDKKDLIKELLSLIEGDLTAEKSGEGEVTGDPATVEAPAGDDKMSAVTDLLEQIKGKLGGEEGGKSEQFGGTNGSDIKKMFGIL